jgi:hypothetical protein
MHIHYQDNQFDNHTKNSFKGMLVITNDHYPKLVAQQADPDIADLLARTQTPHDNYLKEYSGWKNAKAAHKGSTATAQALISELSGIKARKWESAVIVEYDKGTEEHTTIFPEGRSPFQNGTIDERVSAVLSLRGVLADYPSLATVLTDVDAFHTQLKTARDTQQTKEQLKAQASTDLETARKAIAIMLYRNMGVLMDKFGDDTEQIANYYEFSLLQQHPSDGDSEVEGTVDADSTVNILELTGSENSLVISNTGVVGLTFCLAAAEPDACVAGVTVSPGHTEIVTLQQLGDPANTYLNVTNNNTDTAGSYSVEVA